MDYEVIYLVLFVCFFLKGYWNDENNTKTTKNQNQNKGTKQGASILRITNGAQCCISEQKDDRKMLR